MKKLLLVLAIGAFAACGNGTDDTTAEDSTMMMDTVAPMMPDTTMRDTSTMMGDTSTMMVDTTKM